jgi:glycosyltransferase involved in cell wall biosynthesis
MNPFVTIVTATYRTRVDHLTTAIRSALDQTWPHIEVIVSDDSPDQSLKSVVEAFGDSRVRYRHNAPSLGVAKNHWAAFREARGDYIALLNHDDRLAPTFVDRLLEPLIADSSLAMAFCDHWVMNAEGNTVAEDTERSAVRWGRAGLRSGKHQPAYDLLAAQTIPLAIGALFRRDRLPAILPDHAGPAYDFWLAYLLCRGGEGVYYLPERLASWRAHAESITSRGSSDWAYGAAEGWRAVFNDSRLSSIHDVARRKAAAAYASCALDAWLLGRRARCASFAWRGISAVPTWRGLAAACLPLVPRSVGARILARARH